jgi:hypothetical protein
MGTRAGNSRGVNNEQNLTGNTSVLDDISCIDFYM